MRDIKFNCPHCDQHISIDEAGRGCQIDCPNCQRGITVPNVPKTSSWRLWVGIAFLGIVSLTVVGVLWGGRLSWSKTGESPAQNQSGTAEKMANQIPGNATDRERIKRGGKTWSAPAEYKIGNVQFQEGDGFLIWPADDPVVLVGKGEGIIRLKWLFGIGRKPPTKKPLLVQTRALGAFKDPTGKLLTKTELTVVELKEGNDRTCDVSVSFESGIETAELLIQFENSEFGKSNLLLIPLKVEPGTGKWIGRGQIRESQIVRESVAIQVKGTKAHSVSFGGKKHWQFDTTVDLNRLEGASADDSGEPIWILYYYAPLGNPTGDEMRKLLYGLRPMGKPGTSMVESFSDKRKIRFEEHVFSLKPNPPNQPGAEERELYWAAVCPNEPSERWTLSNSREITFPIFGFSMKKLFGGDFSGSPSDGGIVAFAVCRFEEDGPILLSEPMVAQVGSTENARPR